MLTLDYNLTTENDQDRIKDVLQEFMKTKDIQMDHLRESIDCYHADYHEI